MTSKADRDVKFSWSRYSGRSQWELGSKQTLSYMYKIHVAFEAK